jgi:hypothetical protein
LKAQTFDANFKLKEIESIHFEEEMMRISKAYILFCAVVLLALLVAFPSHAGQKTAYTATGYLTGVNSFGTLTCPGYPDLHPTFPNPCPGRTNLRGYVFTERMLSPDSPINGDATIEWNFDVDSHLEGQYWGKWSIVLDDGGILEGSYAGKILLADGLLLARGKSNLYIRGGALDGCILTGDSVTVVGTGMDIYTGYILDPHASK